MATAMISTRIADPKKRQNKKKGGQVGTALLYSSFNGCVIFEHNDIPLYTKNDSERLEYSLYNIINFYSLPW